MKQARKEFREGFVYSQFIEIYSSYCFLQNYQCLKGLYASPRMSSNVIRLYIQLSILLAYAMFHFAAHSKSKILFNQGLTPFSTSFQLDQDDRTLDEDFWVNKPVLRYSLKKRCLASNRLQIDFTMGRDLTLGTKSSLIYQITKNIAGN